MILEIWVLNKLGLVWLMQVFFFFEELVNAGLALFKFVYTLDYILFN